MKKRLLSLLLVLAVLMGMAVPMTVGAANYGEVYSDSMVNPLYKDFPQPPAAQTPAAKEASDGLTADAKTATYVDSDTAADQLRAAMVNRQASVTLYVQGTYTRQWFEEAIFDRALSMELAKCPFDGDYLQWSWGNLSWSYSQVGANQCALTVYPTYYTTAADEAVMAQKLGPLVDSLNLDSLSDYAAYTAIYEYITKNITYDYDGLDTFEDSIEGNEDYYIFTAYAALTRKTAVCQGYATLFYAMCWEAELPVRVITSYNHAYNIVYLKNIWYYVDSTWDSYIPGRYPATKDWYLLGSDNFCTDASHVSEEQYLTPEFIRDYPISAMDYDPDSPYNDVAKDSVHYGDILEATDIGLFTGTDPYIFSPKQEMSRAMMITLLWRLEGKPKSTVYHGFDDVPRNEYYADAVSWAVESGIVKGYGDGNFGPDDLTTREDMVTAFYRYATYLRKDTSAYNSLDGFKDKSTVDDYALAPMQWAVGSGLVNGVEKDLLGPLEFTTREQLASLSMRLIRYYKLR